MTPSNANTSGLEVVAWRVKHPRHDAHRLCFVPAPADEAEPLVTAASAQAEREQYGRWLVAMANDRDAEKARADRLAKALEETRNRVREWPIGDHETCMCGSPVASHGMGDGHSPVPQGDHAISMIVEAITEALQQEG